MQVRCESLAAGNSFMDCVVFGSGERQMVLLPGLSTRRLSRMAGVFGQMYRLFAREFTVYVLDRRQEIPEDFSVEDMASDAADAMEQLGVGRADVLGISLGGMIAMALALDRPRLVDRAALAVTAARPNDTLGRVLTGWMGMADRGDWEGLNLDTFQKVFSDAWLARFGRYLPQAAKLTKPDDLHRFRIQARACLTFDVWDRLEEIRCPVLVLGGSRDRVVTGEASQEIARRLHCPLRMYEDLGHAAWQEAKDFSGQVCSFFLTDESGR